MTDKVKIPGIEGEWVETAYENLSDRYVIISEGRISTCISDARYYTPVPPDWRVLPEGPGLDRVVRGKLFGIKPNDISTSPLSTDVGEAMHVVDMMQRRGYRCYLKFEPNQATATFVPEATNFPVDTRRYYTWGGNLECMPEAICRAALSALECESKT